MLIYCLLTERFYAAVDLQLFKTGLLDSLNITLCTCDEPRILEDWRIRRSYGADRFWHQYTIYRVHHADDTVDDRFRKLNKIAVAICEETNGDFDEILKQVCWLAVESTIDSMVGYWDGRNGRHYSWEWDKSETGTFETALLPVAAHFNLTSLVKKLLQQGGDPTEWCELFNPAIVLAAYAGHRYMLDLLQGHMPLRIQNSIGHDEHSPWSLVDHTHLTHTQGICGAAMRGDLTLFMDVASQSTRIVTFRSHVQKYTPRVDPEKWKRNIHCDNPQAMSWTASPEIWAYAKSFSMRPLELYEGHQTLCQACSYGKFELVRHLVDELHVNVDGRDDRIAHEEDDHYANTQPLRVAARASHVDVVTFLLQRGANPNVIPFANNAPFQENSPLAAAAAAGSLTIVKMLLDRGAEVDSAASTLR